MKDFIYQLKWLFTRAKPVLPHLILIIIVGSVLSLSSVYKALITKSLVDAATSSQNSELKKIMLILILIFVFETIIKIIKKYVKLYANNKLTNDLHKRLYTHVTNSEWLEQSKYHSVSLLSRITVDTSAITNMILSTVPSIISAVVLLSASAYTLFKVEPTIAIIAVVLSPIFIIVSKLFTRKLKHIYKEINEQNVKYKSFMQETINNIIVVKTFCHEDENLKNLETLQKEKLDLALKSTRVSVVSKLILKIGTALIYFLVLGYGIFQLSKGKWTYGTLTAMLQLSNSVQSPFSSLAKTAPGIIECFASLERILEIESLSLEENNKNIVIEDNNSYSIVFKNVDFEYKENNPILKNISFNINPGEKVAFIGPSGEGKTTLIRMILSLIHNQSGSASFINNTKIEPINRKHRNLISYIPQGNTLFSGSIRDNLIYGNTQASDQEIFEALKAACAYDFVNSLEDKLDTIIGEKGLGISEGQAQRIAIARAFLRKKPILILDEATSALDSQTEVDILKSVNTLSHNPTCIIITHRPSALRICDRIFNLSKGHLNTVEKYYLEEVALTL